MDPLRDPAGLPDALRAAGFGCHLRHQGWWECLLVDDDRSWLGCGENEEEAVFSALAAMIPSPRARALFRLAMALPSEPAPSPAPTVVKAEPPEPVLEPEPEPKPPKKRAQSPPPSPPSQPRRPSPTEKEVQAGLEELSRLRLRIADAIPELAELSPRWICLNLLGWISEARSFNDRFPNDGGIQRQIYLIAQELQKVAKSLWPGNVAALQLRQTPLGSSGLLWLPEGHPVPAAWSELADEAAKALESEAEHPGIDEDGWADDAALTPAPLAPAALLKEVRSRVEKLTGPLGADASPTPGLRLDRQQKLREELLELARKLRWLRGATPDSVLWGRIAGRFRCIAHRHARTFPELGRILDRNYRPRGSWALELGQDPTAKLKRRRNREVYESRPGAGAEAFEVRSWLLKAFDSFTNPQIAGMVDEVRDIVLRTDHKEFPDSRARKRLRRLQEMLVSEAENPTLVAEIHAAAEAVKEEGVVQGGAEEARDLLRARARAHTQGRSLLFVSNRKDPQLEQRLCEILEPREMDWCDGKSRQIASAVERIRSGRYDLVIGATGFMGHKVESKLVNACTGLAGYVRAFKGRELACLRAIVRDLR